MRSDETSPASRPAPTGGGLRVRTYDGSGGDLALLAQALRGGELVAIPTETVYGLAANALDAAACRRIFEVKGRPLIDPLIVHVRDLDHAAELADVNEAARALAGKFWPGALTFVLPRHPVVPDIVTAGLPTVAVRCPGHPLARALLRECGLPLAAPSANPFGYVSPTTARHVIQSLGDRIQHLLDGGPCEIGLESTIIDLADPAHPVLLRPGAVTAAAIADVLGVEVNRPAPALADAPARAPGMLERHYSPRTPLELFDHGSRPEAGESASGAPRAIIYFTRATAADAGDVAADVFWLSEDGSLESAARHIFALLRRLDAGAYDLVFIERAPEGGLGDAINDRLQRAARR